MAKNKRISNRPFAVIFDMDGVIVDNMSYHREAWKVFIRKHAPHVAVDDFAQHFGKINDDLFPLLFGRKLSKAEVQVYADEKEALYRKLYAKDIALLPGLADFLKELKANRIRTVIATSAPKLNVDFTLDGLKIRGYFDAVIDASEVKKGKPDPEIYLKAARKAGFPPRNCLVFEDSLPGIQAALTAGMKVVGVATSHPPARLAGARIVIREFRNVSLDILTGLFSFISSPGP